MRNYHIYSEINLNLIKLFWPRFIWHFVFYGEKFPLKDDFEQVGEDGQFRFVTNNLSYKSGPGKYSNFMDNLKILCNK